MQDRQMGTNMTDQVRSDSLCERAFTSNSSISDKNNIVKRAPSVLFELNWLCIVRFSRSSHHPFCSTLLIRTPAHNINSSSPISTNSTYQQLCEGILLFRLHHLATAKRNPKPREKKTIDFVVCDRPHSIEFHKVDEFLAF